MGGRRRGGDDPGRRRLRHQRHRPLRPPDRRGVQARRRRDPRPVPVLQPPVAGRHRGPPAGRRRGHRPAGHHLRHPGADRAQDLDAAAGPARPRGRQHRRREGRRRQPGRDGPPDRCRTGRLRGLQRRRRADAAAAGGRRRRPRSVSRRTGARPDVVELFDRWAAGDTAGARAVNARLLESWALRDRRRLPRTPARPRRCCATSAEPAGRCRPPMDADPPWLADAAAEVYGNLLAARG